LHKFIIIFFLLWRCYPTRVIISSCLRFLNHTKRSTNVGRTPLDEWSARRRDLYLTTHNTHNSQKSMPSVGFFLLHIFIAFFCLHMCYYNCLSVHWVLRSPCWVIRLPVQATYLLTTENNSISNNKCVSDKW
jgi:hypothetical protein